MPVFGIYIESDFNPIIAQIDNQARSEKTSRSAIVRDILFAHFGLSPQKEIKTRDRARKQAN